MKKLLQTILLLSLSIAVALFYYGWKMERATRKMDTITTVTSKDGTTIAYDVAGTGPAVILIGGALVSRDDHEDLAKRLSAHFTVYNYDRRGRGESGDAAAYAVAREIEDLEALIEVAGGSAYLYGISSGACLALEATAALGPKVKKLAVYEAPYDEAPEAAAAWKQYRDHLLQLLSEDERGEAVDYHLKFVGLPALAILALKVLPGWQKMKGLAHTLAYDVAVVGEDRSIPVDRFATLQAKTLVMDGGASEEDMPFMRVTADKLAHTIPQAQRQTLEGEDHAVDEKVMAPILVGFFGDEQ